MTHLCWNDGNPDPRVLQIGFTFLLVGTILLRYLGPVPPDLESWPVLGALLSIVAAVLIVVLPGRLRRPWLYRTFALLNIVALGMLADGPELGGASPLVVLPALWLGLELGLAGAALAVFATVVFMTIPGLIYHGFTPENVERLALLPVLAGVSGAAITAGVTAARTAMHRAENREADLAEALNVIERNRRSAYAIFEAVDIGLALLDRDGEPQLMNQRLEQLSAMAYPGGDITNHQVFDEDGTTRLAIDDLPTARARRGEEFDGVRVWIGQADDETRRAIAVSARRVEEPDGSLGGAAVSYTDITDYMRAAEVKSDFIALVSHELRTPLTSISGYVSVILERPDLPDQVRAHLETVARNAGRLERLVESILDTVQHSSGLMRFESTPIDFSEVVKEVVTAAEPAARAAGVNLRMRGPLLVRVEGDRQRLVQVVENLVSNALKYTPHGGDAVVQLAVEDGHAVLRVRDTGIGIHDEDQEQLFTRFYRTREATRLAIQGVGLGLSIVKAIVDGHGGEIEVESAVGSGTEFCVRLPLTLVVAA